MVKNKETFDWIDNIISRDEWEKQYRNERTIRIKGEANIPDIEDYIPPFHIKILEIKDRIAIVKFSSGNFDYIKNIAMEIGACYPFGRWAICIDGFDEKKGHIVKIREK